jgi:hypothetical protein
MFGASKSGSVVATDPYFSSVVLLLNGEGTNGSQNNTFLDSSTNNLTLTRSGNTTQGSVNPFSVPAPYSTNGNSGSMSFDGTTDWLVTSALSANQLTGNFTIECWVYPFTVGTQQGLVTITNTTSSGANGLSVYLDTSNKVTFYNAGNTTVYSSAINAVSANNWYHIALVRNSTTNTLYINGVSAATSSTTPTWPATPTIGIGRVYNDNTSFTLNGYLSNVRIVKGTAVYTANFTPPTAPLTAITNTYLLLSGTNAGIYDSGMDSNFETVGNAQVSTAVKKYGTGSIAFDGTGDWLLALNNTSQQLSTGDFTIEGWVYLNAIGVAYGIVSKGAATTGWSVNITSGNKLQFSYTAANLTGATSLAASTWYYVTVVRSGSATGNVKVYLNGVLDATSGTAVTDNFNQTTVMYVGASRTATTALNGYIDDLRITKSVARYVANFTPPTQPLPIS